MLNNFWWTLFLTCYTRLKPPESQVHNDQHGFHLTTSTFPVHRIHQIGIDVNREIKLSRRTWKLTWYITLHVLLSLSPHSPIHQHYHHLETIWTIWNRLWDFLITRLWGKIVCHCHASNLPLLSFTLSFVVLVITCSPRAATCDRFEFYHVPSWIGQSPLFSSQAISYFGAAEIAVGSAKIAWGSHWHSKWDFCCYSCF